MKHLIMAVLLSGCSMLSALVPSLGGGTNVAANTQVGKENNQTGVVVGEVKTNKIEAENIGKLTQSEQAVEAKDSEINIQNIPPWVMILMLLGWLLPSPGEIYTGIKKEAGAFFGLFRRKRQR